MFEIIIRPGGMTRRRTEKEEDFCDVGNFDSDELEGLAGGGMPPNPEFDDWSRVLTTSRGHVRMAPVVPPILKHQIIKF